MKSNNFVLSDVKRNENVTLVRENSGNIRGIAQS